MLNFSAKLCVVRASFSVFGSRLNARRTKFDALARLLMKTEIENVTDVKKVIHFEIPWEDVDKHIKDAVRTISKTARVPGFRPGKAPQSMIRSRYAQHIKDEVIQHVVPEAYQEAISENGLDVISEPEIQDVLYTEGSPFSFKVTVETKPRIDLKDYKGLSLKTLPVEVKEEEVESLLKTYQQRAAELIPLEGTAATRGHFLSTTVKATIEQDGKKQKVFDDRTLVELGSEENHAAFNENLEGRKAGDVVEFTADYPEDYPEKAIAGKKIHYRVQVESVNERRLPALDDEFAKDLGDFKSLDELRSKIRKDLEQMKTNQQHGNLQDQALGQVIEKNPFEVPESLVKKEAASLLQNYAYSLHQRGVNLDSPDLKWDELRARFEKQADQNVRGSLLMEAIAQAEKIEITDEDVDKRVQQIAEQERRAPEAVKADILKQENGMERLKQRLLISKTADFILDQANIEYMGKESEKKS
jgi:trigger factor